MDNTVTVAVIRPSGPVETVDVPNDLATFQGLVGGYIEAVGLLADGTIAFVHEEGKLKDEALNPVATELLRQAGSFADDYVAGTMVVVGPADDNGDITSITADAVALIDTYTH